MQIQSVHMPESYIVNIHIKHIYLCIHDSNPVQHKHKCWESQCVLDQPGRSMVFTERMVTIQHWGYSPWNKILLNLFLSPKIRYIQSQLTIDFKYVINSNNLKLLSNLFCHDLNQNTFVMEAIAQMIPKR